MVRIISTCLLLAFAGLVPAAESKFDDYGLAVNSSDSWTHKASMNSLGFPQIVVTDSSGKATEAIGAEYASRITNASTPREWAEKVLMPGFIKFYTEGLSYAVRESIEADNRVSVWPEPPEDKLRNRLARHDDS